MPRTPPLPPALVGSWDGWAEPGLRAFDSVAAADGTVWRTATIELPPGTYRYSILVGDLRVADELNPRTRFVAGPDDPFETRSVGGGARRLQRAGARRHEPRTPTATRSSSRPTSRRGADGVGLDPSTLAATLTQAGAPVAPVAVTHAGDRRHARDRARRRPRRRQVHADADARAIAAAARSSPPRRRFVATPLAPGGARRHARLPGHDRSLPRRHRAARRAGLARRPRRRHARRRARRARRRLLRSPRRHHAVALAGLHQPERSPRRPRRPPGRALPRLLARGSARRRSRARRRGRARRARRRRARARPPRAPRRRAQPRLPRRTRGTSRTRAPPASTPPLRRRPSTISWFNDGPDALRLRRSRLRLGREHGDLLVRALPARSQLAPPRRRRRRHRRSRLVDVALRPRRAARRRRADDAARRQPPHGARACAA